MRAYELMVILSGDLDEPVAQGWVKTITDQIAAKGGRVVGSPDWWGKRRFAYEINHRHEGYYAVLNVVAPGGALDDLERSLRLADDVVRHKLLRLPDAEAARRGMADAAV
ncbi:MAG TPA: 30S ribosomal protein S6 [Acidimicrobiales bacterium]